MRAREGRELRPEYETSGGAGPRSQPRIHGAPGPSVHFSAKAVAANEVWHGDAMTSGGACRDVSGREIRHDYQSGAGSTIMD